MIDHLGMPVSDLARATEFYLKALEPLGYGIVMQVSAEQTGQARRSASAARQGADFQSGKPSFWIGEGERLGGHIHVAFVAVSREASMLSIAPALAAGGKDNGPPGLRPHYHANYYGAFVLDLDGNNIEAVCHAPAL